MLFFTDNQLTTLPNYIFKGLTNIQVLELDGNKLITLPEHLFDSEPRKLTSLILTNNLLTTLPSNVFKPLSFRVVDLANNQLDYSSREYFY